MWPDPLRLALSEHGDEDKAGGQPTQHYTNPSPEYRKPEPSGTGGIMESPTPEKPTTEEAEKTPGPSERISVHFKTRAHCLPRSIGTL